MSLKLECPKCGKSLKAPDEVAGKRCKCPACGHTLTVPSKPPSESSAVAGSVGRAAEKVDQAKTGNWRPGEKVPKTGTYKCLMCGPGGGLMHALNLATGLAGIKPAGLAASQPMSTKFFWEGELFTKCPNCAAIAADAGTASDMTGWDFVSAEEVTSGQPTSAEAPKPPGPVERGNCDVCNESIVKSAAKVVTTAELQQATKNGYCGKQHPLASAMGFDKEAAWQITLSMGAATNWALCAKCAAEVESYLGKEARKTGCFVATACYGAGDAPQVLQLRAFRDEVLLPSAIGRRLVSLYCRHSPPLAAWIASRPVWRWILRRFLIAPLAFLASAFRTRCP